MGLVLLGFRLSKILDWRVLGMDHILQIRFNGSQRQSNGDRLAVWWQGFVGWLSLLCCSLARTGWSTCRDVSLRYECYNCGFVKTLLCRGPSIFLKFSYSSTVVQRLGVRVSKWSYSSNIGDLPNTLLLPDKENGAQMYADFATDKSFD